MHASLSQIGRSGQIMPSTRRHRPAIILLHATQPPLAHEQEISDEEDPRRLQRPRPHWVGDGFPVRSLFSLRQPGRACQPVPAARLCRARRSSRRPTEPRGVGEHPHRGFETVTIVYEGEVEHRDSTGNGGVIGPGDVQWMTAASGILHEEFHSRGVHAAAAARFEMVQLWVNLPAKDKMAPPGYQTHARRATFRRSSLPDGAGTVRVIAGEFDGATGTGAHVHADQHLGPAAATAASTSTLDVPEGHTLGAGRAARHGPGQRRTRSRARRRWCCSTATAAASTLEANSDATLLVLSGEPIDEPVVGARPVRDEHRRRDQAGDARFPGGRFGAIRETEAA